MNQVKSECSTPFKTSCKVVHKIKHISKMSNNQEQTNQFFCPLESHWDCVHPVQLTTSIIGDFSLFSTPIDVYWANRQQQFEEDIRNAWQEHNNFVLSAGDFENSQNNIIPAPNEWLQQNGCPSNCICNMCQT